MNTTIMTKKEKQQLLLKDLCARLPYGVRVNIIEDAGGAEIDDELTTSAISHSFMWTVKPYLRPMSSMTNEEKREYDKLIAKCIYDPEAYFFENYNRLYDWLLSHHFDFRGLIKKGLALEAPKDMY